MKAYIIQSNKKIDPLFVKSEDVLIKNKTLAFWQERALSCLGLRAIKLENFSGINDDEEHIVFYDNLYFEPELLKSFIEESRGGRSSTVCAVKTGIFTIRTLSNLQEIKERDNYVEYGLFYFPSKRFRNDLEPKPIVFDNDENFEKIKLPKHMQGDENYLIPVTEKTIIQINHWSNVWSANLFSILADMARLQKSNKLKLLFLAFRSLSFNKWRVVNSVNKIGKNCDIHPTAYIEGSIVGDNVVIGAGKVIRESVIGGSSFIGNGITIETSMIGDNCTILNGHILYSVFFSGVFSVTHMISASIVGKNSFIGSGSVLTDFRFDGKTVRVTKEAEEIDTDNLFCGCCLGNNVYLGANCVIAPGRMIPSNTRIVLSKDRIITRIDNGDSLPGFRIIK